jgi:hypothetical protein
VEQADHVVNDDGERLATCLGKAVGDLHGDLFVLAEQHRWIVAIMVDQGIVEPTIASAGIQRDVGEAELLDQVGNDVGLPAVLRACLLRLSHHALLQQVHRCATTARKIDRQEPQP